MGEGGSSARPIRVLVADAQLLFAEALGGLIDLHPDMSVCPILPTTGCGAMEAAIHHHPDVILLDLWMPDIEGPAAARMMLAKDSRLKVIIVAWFFGTEHIERALSAGAVGFLPKSIGVGKVIEGIRSAAQGESPILLSELEELFKKVSKRGDRAAQTLTRLEGLSPRELQILTLLSLHLSIQEVADELVISPTTVKTHVRNMLRKTDSRSTREIVNMAMSCGLIRP